MAEKNKDADLGERVEGSILNVTQDNLISTNESSDENVQLEISNVIETVNVECSNKSDNVNIFKQLALMMEMMSEMRNELKSENNNINTCLNEFKNEMKSENDNL